MRFIVALCALFCGACEYETNNYETNYYGGSDAGLVDTATGDGDEMIDSPFEPGSKLQGQAILQLQPSLAPPVAPNPWPDIYGSPQYSQAQTLIDVTTKGGLPRVMTVSLGNIADRPVNDGLHTNSEVVGIIELGIGGLIYFVYVDFVQGVQFSVAANRLKLSALFIALPGSPWVPPATRPTYNVGAALSVGIIAHGRQPQRTIAHSGAPALAANAFERWNIPPFTKSCRVTAMPNNSQIDLSILNLAGLGPATYGLVAYPSQDLPLPSDSRFFYAQNVGLAAVTDYRIVCDLSL